MRRLLSLLLLLFTLNVFGQSVAGVSLRDEYSKVERTLEQRYGTAIVKEYNEISYKEITVGGITYEFSDFEFLYRNTTQDRRLNSVRFSNRFKLTELNKAKSHRDYIASVYAKKYNDIEETKDEYGFKMYRCSYNPLSESFRIIIYLVKGESKGGDTYYYVVVHYGPAYYDNIEDDI